MRLSFEILKGSTPFFSLQSECSLCLQAGMSNSNSIHSLLCFSLIWILQHGVVSACKWVIVGDFTSLRVGTEWSSKQQNEWFRSMNFVMYPTARLLDSEVTPLLFEEETVAGHLLVRSSRKQDMSIFVFVVLVLFRVLDLVREMRHYSNA